MKKVLFLLLLLMFSLWCHSQSAQKFDDNGKWRLASINFESKYASDKTVSGEFVAPNMNDSITATLHKDLIPYKDFIKEAFNKMRNIKFIKKHETPELIKFKGTDCVIFKNAISGTIYNNLKLNERERAMATFISIGTEMINNIGKAGKKAPAYIGISSVYSSQDFSEKNELPQKEVMVVILPYKSIKDFANYEISEDALIKKADVLISPSKGVMKCIELSFQ